MNQSTALPPPSAAPGKPKDRPMISRLRVRLLIMVSIAVLPALILVLFNTYEQRKLGLNSARVEASRIISMASARHDQLMDDCQALLQTLAELPDVLQLNANSCQAILTNILRFNPVYTNIAVVDLEGNVIASGLPPGTNTNIADRAYFHETTNSMAFTVGGYLLGRFSKAPVLVMAQPAMDNQGTLRAVVVAGLDLQWMYRLHASAELPAGSSFTIFDRDWITLARHPNPQGTYVGERIGGTNNPDRPFPKGESSQTFRGRDGVLRLYTTRQLGFKLGKDSAGITVGIPIEAALAASNQLLQRDLLFLLTVAALSFLAAWFGGDYFVLRRVRRLLQATDQLRGGDLTARTGETQRRGELQELAWRFDEMAASLERQFAERQEAQDALRSLNDQLEQHVQDRTRALKRSNEDLEQFAYVASHDLQEPLRMITSYLTLLKQRYHSQLDSDAHEFIGFAVDGAERMQRLIRDLLSYSRVQTKAMPFEDVDMNALMDRIRDNLKITIQESGARVTNDLLPTVQADPTQMTQLLQNLIGNGIKFHNEKPPQVHVDASRENGHWHFRVRDNGIGIPPDQHERIFVIFQRLHGRDKYSGTGIGLSICKKIVERHGGKIHLTSQPGQGTTFHFTIPLKPAPQQPSA